MRVIKEAIVAVTLNPAELVRVDDRLGITERGAIAGFLDGYTGNTLVSYTTDLRIFAEWCTNNDVRLLKYAVLTWRSSVAPWKPTAGCAPLWPADSPR